MIPTEPTTAGSADAFEGQKRAAGAAAAALVESGMAVGLGTGSTARHVVAALAARLADGAVRDIVAVATSEGTAAQARSLGIPLATLDERPTLDLAIDGADEIGPGLALVKGGGGAHVRELLVARAAARFVVVADARKLVDRLATRMPLPVAVLPFGWSTHLSALKALGAAPVRRMAADGQPFVTDDGLYVLDCAFADGISDPHAVIDALAGRPGIVASGLFLEMAELAFVAAPDGVAMLGVGWRAGAADAGP